jgi:hypothetical protein
MTDSALQVALYASVWAAIVLYAAGEAGKAAALRAAANAPLRWPWLVWTTGAVLLLLHILLALHVRHAWSHASVVASVREQTRSIYGVNWGGGVWVNYLFLAQWLGEAVWWRLAPRAYFTRPRLLVALSRGFFALVLVNGAIVFAAPSRRVPGILLMLVLCWAWRSSPMAAMPTFSRDRAASGRL